MATISRVLVRSIGPGTSFNGTTGDTSTGYTPSPTQNGRSYKFAAGNVGRFGFGVQGRKGTGCAFFKARVYGALGVNSRVEIHSGIEGDAPVGDRDNQPVGTTAAGPVETTQDPQDTLLEVFTLTNSFTDATWHRLGPTDAICVFHTPALGSGDTVEILIVEGDESDLAAFDCCSGGECACECDIETTTITSEDEGPTAIPAWECELSAILEAENPGDVFTLPASGGMTPGAQIFIRADAASSWFTVQPAGADTINGVAAPSGVIFQDVSKAVLFRLSTGGWLATDVISELTPISQAVVQIPVFSGDRVYTANNTVSVQVPAAADIAEGQRVFIINSGTGTTDKFFVTVGAVGDTIDGIANGRVDLPNGGDVVCLLRDGSAGGWVSLWNRFDRAAGLNTSAGAALAFTTGQRGTVSYAFTNVAADIPVTLPAVAASFRGFRVYAYRTTDGTITFDAGAGNIIVGAGSSAQTLVHAGANNIGFVEFEGVTGAGGGVWSYHCCAITQARPALITLANDTPVPLAVLARDVTIQQVASNAVNASVVLPAITVASDLPRILKIFNTGSEDLLVAPPGGSTVNGSPTGITIPPAAGSEFQPVAGTSWHANAGAT